MIPGELLDHVIIHQERAADHSHYEVGDGQVGDQQVGEAPEFLVSGQSGYEEEVTEPHTSMMQTSTAPMTMVATK